ncbi:MAG: tyrosine-type recombinase/integrase [Desulfobacterales bacterium]|nr:tyrosine-type recombinase/integrase [Desulfobacterales bacterium]
MNRLLTNLGKKLSPGSEHLYTYWQGRFQDWLEGRSPSTALGEAFLVSLEAGGLKPNTVGCAARALRRMGLDVPVPSMEWGEPNYLELEEVKRLIDRAPSLLVKTIIIVIFSAVARISEVLNLEVQDLELDAGVATMTRKGGRRERVALGKQGTEALREWLAHRRSRSKRVFMDYTYQDIYRMLKKLAREVGIPDFTPHRLRHSRVRHLRQAGLDWEDISELAGHTKTETTIKIYGRRKAEERARLLVDF